VTFLLLSGCGLSQQMAWQTTVNGCHDPLTPIYAGVATFYEPDGPGNCGLPTPPGESGGIAAINLPQYEGGAICGACMRVRGPGGSVRVRIINSCPECPENHIDLSREAFARIADPVAGRVPIHYQIVPCDSPGGVFYRVKEGSSKYWLAVQVRNHRLPIRKLEYQRPDGRYAAMARQPYNYFIAEDLSFHHPDESLPLRVTAVDGQHIQDRLPGIVPGKVYRGARQFQVRECGRRRAYASRD
jgi:expansin (peptidoglycan-binding protein)